MYEMYVYSEFKTVSIYHSEVYMYMYGKMYMYSFICSSCHKPAIVWSQIFTIAFFFL